jgi:hypothetical protein
MGKPYSSNTQEKTEYFEPGSSLSDSPPHTYLKFSLPPEDCILPKPEPEKPKKRFKELAKSLAKYIGENKKKINLFKYFGKGKKKKKIKIGKLRPNQIRDRVKEEEQKGNKYLIF